MHQGSKPAVAAVREIISKQITSICLHHYIREYNCLGLSLESIPHIHCTAELSTMKKKIIKREK